MLTKTIVGIATILCSLVAHAQTSANLTQARKTPATPAQILERVKAASPVADCAGVTEAGANSTIYSLADGSRYEFSYADNGKIAAVTAVAASGRRVTVDSSEGEGAANDSLSVGAQSAAVDSQKLKARLRADVNKNMEKFLKSQCAKFARQEAARRGDTDSASESAEAAEADGDERLAAGATLKDAMYGPSSRGWEMDDFFSFADAFLFDNFSMASFDFQEYVSAQHGRGRGQLPKCRVIVQECNEFCSSMERLEHSGCGALALAAAFTLGPPTGAAVGFYCSGNVYLATEQCRTKCQTPTVVCSWN